MKEGAISPYIVLAPAEDDADGEEPQMSIANTGWSEEEMERMRERIVQLPEMVGVRVEKKYVRKKEYFSIILPILACKYDGIWLS